VSALEARDLDSPSPAPAVSPQRLAEGLYERHSKRILGFCARRLATREEAEDAVQTTFLYALRALQRGVVPVSETAWLFKIAENVCLATHRTNGRRRARELAESPEIEDRSSESENGREAGRELVRALSTIPESQRKALLLREWRGLSYREISVQLGVTVASVETLIFRARRGVVRALNGETTVRGRVAGALNLGTLANASRGLFGSGATAAKLAAAAAVVTVVALPAADAPQRAAKQAAGTPRTEVSAPVTQTSSNSSISQSFSRAARRAKGQKPGRRAGTTAKAPSKPTGGASRTAAPAGAASQSAGTPALPSVPSVPSAPSLPVVPAVEPPAIPPVNLPTLPEVPQLPTLPALPALPVAPPDLPAQIPALPELP
jgi:RNA polymerase sigma-70 factor (ECF subfamily)